MNEPLGEREILCVSQFTLLGDVSKGNRPSFVGAAPGEVAEPLYERVCELLGAERGVFGARMEVELVNDGPVTLLDRGRKRPNALEAEATAAILGVHLHPQSNPLREVGRRPAFFSASTGLRRDSMSERTQNAKQIEREIEERLAALDPAIELVAARAPRRGDPAPLHRPSRRGRPRASASASPGSSATSSPTTRSRSPRPGSTGR